MSYLTFIASIINSQLTTNYAGDFMIFGVPLGSYTVQVDADISDIGLLSQNHMILYLRGHQKNYLIVQLDLNHQII